MAATVKDISIKVNSNGIPIEKTSFSLDLSSPVLGLQVIRVENLTNSISYPTSGIFISYTQDKQNIIITHITGLQPNNSYTIKVIAWHI